MKWKLLLSACFLAVSLCAGAQTTVSIAPDAASKEDVKKLFDVMASRDQMANMMKQVFAQMQTMNREQTQEKPSGPDRRRSCRYGSQVGRVPQELPPG